MKAKRLTRWLVLGVMAALLLLIRNVRKTEADETNRPITSTWPRWSVPVTIGDPPAIGPLKLPVRVATGPSGKVHAVWQDFMNGASVLKYSVQDWPSRGGNGWRPPVPILTIQGGSGPNILIGFDFVIGPSGLSVVFTANYDSPNLLLGDTVGFMSSSDGVNWGNFAQLASFTLQNQNVANDAYGIGAPRLFVLPDPNLGRQGVFPLAAGWTQSAFVLEHQHADGTWYDHYAGAAMFAGYTPGTGWGNATQVAIGQFVADNPFPPHQYNNYAFGDAFPYVTPTGNGLAWTSENIAGDGSATESVMYAPLGGGPVTVPGSTTPSLSGSTPLFPISDVKSDIIGNVHVLWQDSSNYKLNHYLVGSNGFFTVDSPGSPSQASMIVDLRQGILSPHIVWTRGQILTYERFGTTLPRAINGFSENIVSLHMTRDTQDNLHVVYVALTQQGFAINYVGSTEPNVALGTIPFGPNTVADLTTGCLTFTLPLFSSKGVGLSTSMALVYNSLDPTTHTMSPGWRMNYDLALTGNATGSFTATKAGGGTVVFDYDPTLGYWLARKEYGNSSRLQMAQGDPDATGDSQWVMTSKDGMKQFFRGDGKCVRLSDTHGNHLDLIYDAGPRMNLAAITDTARRTTTLSYDPNNGNLLQVRDPGGKTYSLTYTNGWLTSIQFDGTRDTWSFQYNLGNFQNGLLQSIWTPRFAANTALSYTYTYTPTNRVNSVTDPLSYVRRISYNDDVTAPSATYTDRRGNSTTVSTDYFHALPLTTTDALGHSSTKAFDDFTNLTSTTDKNGNVTSYTWSTSNTDQAKDNMLSMQRPGTARAEQYTYTTDGLNRLQTSTDALGATTVNGYNSQTGDLLTINYPPTPDNPTAAMTMTYDTQGRLLTQLEPGHSIATVYGYGGPGDNGTGLVTSITRPGLAAEQFFYDPMGNLVRHIQPDGGETDYTLDGRYRVTDVQGPAGTDGRPLTHTDFDGDGNAVLSRDPMGNETIFRFDNLDRLWQTRYADGSTLVNSTIDPEGNIVDQRDPNGNVTHSDYDPLNRKIHLRPPAPDTQIDYTYDNSGNVLTVAQGAHVTTYTYDARNNRVTTTDTLGNAETTILDDDDDMLTDAVTGAGRYFRGTGHTYDARRRVVTTTQMSSNVRPPAGRTTTFHYSPNSNRTSSVDTLGRTTTYTYDEANRMTSVTDHTLGLTKYTYDSDGNRLTVEVDGPNGGRMVTQVDRYNAADQPFETLDALGRVTRQFFNLNGKLRRTEGPVVGTPGSQQIAFDSAYDNRNRLSTQTAYPLIDANGGAALPVTTTFRYDLNGNRTHVIDVLGRDYQYFYDSHNRLSEVIHPAGTNGVTTDSYFYDSFGNLDHRVDQDGRLHQFHYDSLNRVDEEWHYAMNGSLQEHFHRGYAGPNDLVHVNSDITGVALDWSRDNYGDVREVDWSLAGVLWKRLDLTSSDAYDGVGNRQHMIGADGEDLIYAYDASNRLQSVTRGGQLVARYEYTLAGGLRHTTLANGVEVWRNRDNTGLLTNLRYVLNGSVLASWTYTYDENHNRATQTMDHLGASWSYSHDGIARLLSETCSGGGGSGPPPPDPTRTTTQPAGNQSGDSDTVQGIPGASSPVPTYTSRWTYDGVGNRLAKTSTLFGNSTYAYSGANELTDETPTDGRPPIHYTYDAVGNMTSRQARGGPLFTFGIDHANRIQTVTGPNGTWAYTYAPTGERIARTKAGGESDWSMYDGGNTIADYSLANGAFALTSSYVAARGLDSQVARFVGPSVASQTPNFYVGDALGTVHQILDAGGAIENVNLSDAWGQPVNLGQNPQLPDRYRGLAQREIDDETGGLQYTRARHYAPELGRFVQNDPIQQNRPTEGYTYAGNDPLDRTDPMGLENHHLFPREGELGEVWDFLFGQEFSKHDFAIPYSGETHGFAHYVQNYNGELKFLIKQRQAGRPLSTLSEAELQDLRTDLFKKVFASIRYNQGSLSSIIQYNTGRSTATEFLYQLHKNDVSPSILRGYFSDIPEEDSLLGELIEQQMKAGGGRLGVSRLTKVSRWLKGISGLAVFAVLAYPSYAEAYQEEGAFGVLKRVGKDAVFYDQARLAWSADARAELADALAGLASVPSQAMLGTAQRIRISNWLKSQNFNESTSSTTYYIDMVKLLRRDPAEGYLTSEDRNWIGDAALRQSLENVQKSAPSQ